MKGISEVDTAALRAELVKREELAKQQKAQEKVEAKRVKIKNKLSFSEKLIVSMIGGGYIVIGLAVLYSWINFSETVWVEILDVLKILLPITIGFFTWKARGENIIKIKNNPNFDLEQYANEAISAYMEETKGEM